MAIREKQPGRPGEWLGVMEAARACRVSERTLWRWVAGGVVESRTVRTGRRERRLIRRQTLPGVAMAGPPGPEKTAAPSAAPPGASTPSLSSQPPETDPAAAVLARELARAGAARERLARALAQAEAQLQARAHGEAELRRRLASVEAINAQLIAALARLRARPAVPPSPPRPRWFWPFKPR